MKGRIFDIQRFSQGNGPGIRTTVFMKGCSLRCRWCHNPESLIREKQIMVNLQLCHHCGDCVSVCLHGVHEIVGAEHLIHADRCIGCGKCVDACCYGYLSLQGKDISPVDLADILLKDEGYYKTSDGGVTFSGGEPLLQIAFLEEVSRHLRGTSIYFDTSGCCPEKSFLQMLSIADGVLFDIKHLDSGRHRELTGVGNEQILQNFNLAVDSMKNGLKLQVRIPLIPGENDSCEEIEKVCAYLTDRGIQTVDISAYHDYGLNKYSNLGLKGKKFLPYTQEQLTDKCQVFRQNGVEPVVV